VGGGRLCCCGYGRASYAPRTSGAGIPFAAITLAMAALVNPLTLLCDGSQMVIVGSFLRRAELWGFGAQLMLKGLDHETSSYGICHCNAGCMWDASSMVAITDP
jgi:hypothetical protein